jgi:hypothetical protein
VLRFALFNVCSEHFDRLVGTERDAGLGVDKIGAEPSIKAIQNFIARILVLFVKDSSGGV